MQTTIENGFFIWTMMPSLRCKLNCPHCYLSKEQRKDEFIMSLSVLKELAYKVREYYENKKLPQKRIEFYWYGGEPTTHGIEYFTQSVEILNDVFPASDGYKTRHTMLSALVGVDPAWYDVWASYCNNTVQSSYDGKMRGAGYLRAWEKAVNHAVKKGLKITTISVVNRCILENGARFTLDYLGALGIKETGWLPFMLNDQNASGSYERFSTSMKEYSAFMIEMTKYYLEMRANKKEAPSIGPMYHVLYQSRKGNYANIAGQTLFMLPNGDWALPDYYKNGYQEYLRVFGNGIESSFSQILNSPERRNYLRKQLLRNGNVECQECEHSDCCLMEFWKKNKENDECFGAKTYVEWVKNNPECNKIDISQVELY